MPRTVRPRASQDDGDVAARQALSRQPGRRRAASRRWNRVRGLAGEAQNVALHAVVPMTRRWLVQASSTGPCSMCSSSAPAGRRERARRASGIRSGSRRSRRAHRPVARPACHGAGAVGTRVPLAPEDPRRLREKRAPSSSAKSPPRSAGGCRVPWNRRSARRLTRRVGRQPAAVRCRIRWPPMMTVAATRLEG
jgi:hypothetical protein